MPIKKFLPAVILLGILRILTPPSISWSEEQRHCLWKIESERNTVYFLGSIHMLKEEHYPLSPVIEEAFRQAEVVVFETNLDSMNDPKIQSLILQRGTYLDGHTLKDNLSEQTYAMLEKWMETYGMPVELFQAFKPTTVALTLSVLEAQRLGYMAEYGIDNYFFKRTKEEGKEIQALEPPEAQIELLFNLTDREQELYLRYTLMDIENLGKYVERMVQAWKKGDVDELVSLSTDGIEEYPEILKMYNRLNYQRNRNWIPQIEQMINDERDFFVVVGTLHLAGEESVIDLLQQNGYVAEQL
jgi:uncharacterized protein YbaP (TraB family)